MFRDKRAILPSGHRFRCIASLAGLVALAASQTQAQSASELGQQLSNPISSLVSVPFQLNYDQGIGPTGNGSRAIMNFQPVVPISLGENWNLISRSIVPFIQQDDVLPGTSQSGMGDIVQSLFFSPKAPTESGLIWGAGPVFLLPTGTDDFSNDEFAAGVTGVALKQTGPWTYGALANRLWDVGDAENNFDTSFFQPFVSYTTPEAVTYGLNTEVSYNHVTGHALVPVNFTITKVTTLGANTVSIGGGVRYWADSPENGPEGWGARLILTFLYPR